MDYLLKTQDPDGYMGIYGPTLRWAGGDVDNGELWTQTCIFRGLLAYYEATGRPEVLRAVEKAVQLTMSHYGDGVRDPYGAETQNHNLMFVDVLERLYDLTGNPAYRDFGVYLYRDYSKDMKTDIALTTLLAADHPFMGHGATTYEGLRVPIWAAYVDRRPGAARRGRGGVREVVGPRVAHRRPGLQRIHRQQADGPGPGRLRGLRREGMDDVAPQRGAEDRAGGAGRAG